MRALLALALSSAPALGADALRFNRDIRPVVAEACFHCHGPDPGSRKAGLRLDTEAGFFHAEPGDTPPVVKGDPDGSPLFERLITKDLDEIMPPPKAHRQLKPAEIALIKAWIAQGASWQPHWSFIPPQRPPLPSPIRAGWVKNPVDHFVLAALEAAKLEPAPEAEACALIRRVCLDLTGLPPEPELIRRYLARARGAHLPDDAWAALVDELLARPAYGEHRARFWLDAARYADTHGLHFDNYREIWPYRDWVVRAFNANLPFDRFTVDQLAGDLLPNPSEDQLIATGFHRCNVTTNEGGTIDEENAALYAADRVQTTGWVYLGLTTNCAQCHDHKFDPITTRDFYSLAAFFRNTTQPPKDGNVKDGRGPVLVLPSAQDRPRWQALPAEIAAAQTRRSERARLAAPAFEKWLASAKPADLDKDVPGEGLLAHLPLDSAPCGTAPAPCGTGVHATGPVTWAPGGKLGPAPVFGPGATLEAGNAGDFEASSPFSFGAWVKTARPGVQGAILARMDEKNRHRGWDLLQSDRAFAVHLIHDWPENAIKVATPGAVVAPGKWQHVFVTYDGSGKAEGIRIHIDGVEQNKLSVQRNALAKGASIRTPTPLRIGQRSEGLVFASGSVQDVRLYGRRLAATEVKRIAESGPLRAILAAAPDQRKPEQRAALYNHYLANRDPAWQQADAESARLEAEREAIRQRSPLTHIQEEVKNAEPMANILMRGQYDKPGERVPAAPPAALHPLPPGAPRNRLGLAQWVVDPANPLTARVTVNRFWQELFGQGIVKTPEDFGIVGAPPSHPELLDWLAVEFRDSGWNVKKLMKVLVTSATYRQAAIATPEKLECDPSNTLLSRGPRFRMDAEMVRDYALAASGLLCRKMGGPGTRPYQPEGIWDVVGLPGGDTRNYVQDRGENLYRRTLYHFWKRMAPPPSLEVFNAPSREFCTVRRERTNTPLQALVTMNDPQFVEAARHLAHAALQEAGRDEAKTLAALGLRTLCRAFRDEEVAILSASLDGLRRHYAAHPADAAALLRVGESPPQPGCAEAELAAWTLLANEMLNLDEVLNK